MQSGIILVDPTSLALIPTEGALAFALCHEMGHILANHGGEHLFIILSCSLPILPIFFVADFLRNISFVVFADLLVLPWILFSTWISRRRESEADFIGLQLLSGAGFDPQEAINFFEAQVKNQEKVVENIGKDSRLTPNGIRRILSFFSFLYNHPMVRPTTTSSFLKY